MSEDASPQPADLTGYWSGEYWYDAGMGTLAQFAAHITDAGGSFDGTTLESADFGLGVRELSGAMTRLCGDRPYVVHLHDTRGMGIANASAALDAGARILDGSLGGLGGCPFAPGATGNVVMEDLVYLCESKGFRTGVDIGELIGVRAIPSAEMPQEQMFGALARAGPPRTLEWRRGYVPAR